MSIDAQIMLREGHGTQQTAEALNQRPAGGSRHYTRQDVQAYWSSQHPAFENLPPSPRAARGRVNAGERTMPRVVPGSVPVVTLTQAQFDAQLDALSDACEDIAEAPPGTHSDRVIEKARNVIKTIEAFGSSEDDNNTTQYYAFARTANDVALLRTHGGWPLLHHLGAHEDRALMARRYGPDIRATRSIDIVVNHPLARDHTRLLIEKVLNEDGENPLLFSSTLTEEEVEWHKALGFEPFQVEDTLCILDPKRHPEVWQRTADGTWRYTAPSQDPSSARSFNIRHARPLLPSAIPTFHRAMLAVVLDDEQNSMLEEVWNCLDIGRAPHAVLQSAEAQPNGLTNWKFGVATADFTRESPGAYQYEVHVFANGQDVASIDIEPVFDVGFTASYAPRTDVSRQGPGHDINQVVRAPWRAPENREHIDLMSMLAGTVHWAHRARVRGFFSYMEGEGYQWSDLVPAGNVDVRPALLEQMVARAIELGFHIGTADALNQAFGLDLRTPDVEPAPVEPEHTALMNELFRMASSQLLACIERFLCYLEGQNLRWSDLKRPGSADVDPARLEPIVNHAMTLGLSPQTRNALNKAFSLNMKGQQIHDEPVRREHAVVMNGLPASLAPRQRSYIGQFLCYLESERLLWPHLVPSGDTDPGRARLENLVNDGIAHHGLNARTRKVLYDVFRLTLAPARAHLENEEHKNLMSQLPSSLSSQELSKVRGFLRYLEGEKRPWSSLVQRRDSAGYLIDLESEIIRAIRNEMVDAGIRAPLRKAFNWELRGTRRSQRLANDAD